MAMTTKMATTSETKMILETAETLEKQLTTLLIEELEESAMLAPALLALT